MIQIHLHKGISTICKTNDKELFSRGGVGGNSLLQVYTEHALSEDRKSQKPAWACQFEPNLSVQYPLSYACICTHICVFVLH